MLHIYFSLISELHFPFTKNRCPRVVNVYTTLTLTAFMRIRRNASFCIFFTTQALSGDKSTEQTDMIALQQQLSWPALHLKIQSVLQALKRAVQLVSQLVFCAITRNLCQSQTEQRNNAKLLPLDEQLNRNASQLEINQRWFHHRHSEMTNLHTEDTFLDIIGDMTGKQSHSSHPVNCAAATRKETKSVKSKKTYSGSEHGCEVQDSLC